MHAELTDHSSVPIFDGIDMSLLSSEAITIREGGTIVTVDNDGRIAINDGVQMGHTSHHNEHMLSEVIHDEGGNTTLPIVITKDSDSHADMITANVGDHITITFVGMPMPVDGIINDDDSIAIHITDGSTVTLSHLPDFVLGIENDSGYSDITMSIREGGTITVVDIMRSHVTHDVDTNEIDHMSIVASIVGEHMETIPLATIDGDDVQTIVQGAHMTTTFVEITMPVNGIINEQTASQHHADGLEHTLELTVTIAVFMGIINEPLLTITSMFDG